MFDILYEPDLALGFIWTVLLTFYMLFRSIDRRAVSRNNLVLIIILLSALLAVHGFVSAGGFYKDFSTTPPRIFFAAAPSVLIVLFVVFFRPGWLDVLSRKRLTWLHVVRVFVEIILLGLYYDKEIPKQMTFEGTNFDILSGLTAPVIALTCFRKGKVNRPVLIAWNVICLLLLINVVTTAVLSAPTPFQQLNFNQPNVAVAFFPFAWLPSFVVPVVLFAHLAVLRKTLSRSNRNGKNPAGTAV